MKEITIGTIIYFGIGYLIDIELFIRTATLLSPLWSSLTVLVLMAIALHKKAKKLSIVEPEPILDDEVDNYKRQLDEYVTKTDCVIGHMVGNPIGVSAKRIQYNSKEGTRLVTEWIATNPRELVNYITSRISKEEKEAITKELKDLEINKL